MGAFCQFESPSVDRPPKEPTRAQTEKQRREEAAVSLQEIFQRFSDTRRTKKAQAYRELQQDLADNADVLILSGQITMKEIVSTIQDLEQYLQGEELPEGDDPTTYLSKWLRGEIPGDEFDNPEYAAQAREDMSHVTQT